MALHNLKVMVNDGGKGSANGRSSSESKKTSAEKSKLYKALNYNSTIRGKIEKATSPTTMFAIQSGINLATQTAREFVNYYVSDIGRRNGDSNHQAIVNRKIEKVTDALGIGQGILSGAAAGSMFGLAGAAVGAIVGAASSGISLSYKYAERERAYAHEMFMQSNSQAYNLARANYSALTGRVR